MKSIVAVLFLAACGSSAPATKGTADRQTCEAMQADGRETLTNFVEGNRACTKDEDCVTVGLGASCFDSCTRAIAADRKADYDAAVASVNGGACAKYSENKCPAHIVPPCVPPSPPRCNAGMCE